MSARACFDGESTPGASDLVQIALAVLQPDDAHAEGQPTGSFPRRAILELGALLYAVAALSCALAALWIYASPMLGAAVALLAVSAVLSAVGLRLRLRSARSRFAGALAGSKPGFGFFADDALLAGGSHFFRRRPVLTLAAALLAGVLLGWEN